MPVAGILNIPILGEGMLFTLIVIRAEVLSDFGIMPFVLMLLQQEINCQTNILRDQVDFPIILHDTLHPRSTGFDKGISIAVGLFFITLGHYVGPPYHHIMGVLCNISEGDRIS
jgi:hypothetical protein